MSAEAVKRGRGRPRKDGQPNKSSSSVPVQKNPDCEPATKGYVKCIARQVSDHRHEQNFIPFFNCAIAIICWFVIVYAIVIKVAMPETIYWAISAIAIVTALSTFDGFLNDVGVTNTSNKANCEAIQKYIPPEEIQRVCEVFNKKKECEE